VSRPFKPQILFPTYVIWPMAQARTQLAEEFVETLRAYYRELPVRRKARRPKADS
jgi:hypothetical protein